VRNTCHVTATAASSASRLGHSRRGRGLFTASRACGYGRRAPVTVTGGATVGRPPSAAEDAHGRSSATWC
jgi:hypothetical protein